VYKPKCCAVKKLSEHCSAAEPKTWRPLSTSQSRDKIPTATEAMEWKY